MPSYDLFEGWAADRPQETVRNRQSDEGRLPGRSTVVASATVETR
jgi:hypothetical protein